MTTYRHHNASEVQERRLSGPDSLKGLNFYIVSVSSTFEISQIYLLAWRNIGLGYRLIARIASLTRTMYHGTDGSTQSAVTYQKSDSLLQEKRHT